jgi:biopolymer transport protein ExbB
MFTEGIVTLFQQGGVTLGVLALCSVIVVTVALERGIVFRRVQNALSGLLYELEGAIERGDLEGARRRARGNPGPEAYGLILPLPAAQASPASTERLQSSNLLRVSSLLGHRLSTLATIGSIAPFIGLFGTVLGIMRAFHAISLHRCAGIAVVGAGIAEALVCTAAGLGVAIVAVVLFNAFRTRSKQILEDLEIRYGDLLAKLEEAESAQERDRSAGP